MAFIRSTILLAALLVGPAAAASPLEPVDVGQIVSELGAYFGELASNALSVESAQVSIPATHAHGAVGDNGWLPAELDYV